MSEITDSRNLLRAQYVGNYVQLSNQLIHHLLKLGLQTNHECDLDFIIEFAEGPVNVL